MADINSLVDQLSELTVLEAADLAKALEEKWGVSAAAAVAAAPAAGDGAAPFLLRLAPEVHAFSISPSGRATTPSWRPDGLSTAKWASSSPSGTPTAKEAEVRPSLPSGRVYRASATTTGSTESPWTRP